PPSFLDYQPSILQKYPDRGKILMVRCPSPIRDLLPSGAALPQAELVQNADNAGAKEVVFVSDKREFNLTGEGVEGTQGPALSAYNNAMMSFWEWTGIQRPGVSHRREDPHSVGHFSLGLASVYHLT
ncbi:hypothetical protein DV515_00013625, partial [Chloebia gouldiae]